MSERKRPHIIIFNPDEMRWNTMGHMGNPAALTPNLDRFQEEDAVSFSGAYCQNPVCVPSRCSFATGLYPHVRGHRTMSYLLQPDETSIFKELKEAGYHVWMNARNDLVAGQIPGLVDSHADEIWYGGGQVPVLTRPDLPNHMTDKWEKISEECLRPEWKLNFYEGRTPGAELARDGDTNDVAAAIDRIRRIDELGDKPLCMFLGLINPHPEYRVEEPFFSAIDREKVKEPVPVSACKGRPYIEEKIRGYQDLFAMTPDHWREVQAVYLAQTTKIDWLFGELVAALKEAGIYDDCAIFVFSDHGDYAGDYGMPEKAQNSFPDFLARVPLLVKPARDFGSVDTGISDVPAELVDFYATAMAMAGTAPAHDCQGVDLSPALKDRTRKVREFAHCEGGREAFEWQCDEYHRGPDQVNGRVGMYWPKQLAQSDDRAHARGTMICDGHYKYVHRAAGEDELYDLLKDPDECVNLLACEPGAGILSVRDAMRIELLDWYQRTCDIVPRTFDSRFSKEKLKQMALGYCLPGNEEKVKRLIDANADFGVIMAAAREVH